ncbi:UDP-glucose 4-epimerase GalE [Pullulanibacillus pueri]|nr:UDP-glucose 4-epimerase GalE [Pullulanibacillus pueri]
MTVLVTGGAGYIGSHTCVELLRAGYKVIILDNFSNSKQEVLHRVQSISGKSFKCYQVDLLDSMEIRRVFVENNINAVIHFAGLKAVGESVEKPLAYYHHNITGTLNLCEAMQTFGVRRLVFSSSATVYGRNTCVPFTEEAPLSATNPYGRSKLMLENILHDVYKAHPQWSIQILRYFNPVGAHESGHIGEDPLGTPNNLVPYVAQVAIGRHPYLNIYGNDYDTPDGTGIRDYVHVVDLAQGHVKALEKSKDDAGINAYNLGTGQGYSVLELISTFERISGRQIPCKIVERRQGDIGESYANVAKAQRELGWTAQKSLEDMCRDTWRWQTQNPNGYQVKKKVAIRH